MTTPLVGVPKLVEIARRLRLIFPSGTDQVGYLTREIAAKTIFVMFYANAVDGNEQWIRPNQVARMTDAQAKLTGDPDRTEWIRQSLLPQNRPIRGRWYADNTREPIRDETLRAGLVFVGAVVERPGLSPTSSKPRYAMRPDFAALFLCAEGELAPLLEAWQAEHLSATARARLALMRHGVVAASGTDKIFVRFPNGETRQMSPGPSAVLSKAVIETFATKFLVKPGVILLSESRDKVVQRDETLARAVGIQIVSESLLPDIILVDLGPTQPLIVFVEVVATDGPITTARRDALSEMVRASGLNPQHVAFVTAVMDKASSVYRKISSEIAWGSFVWFASEPENIVIHRRQVQGSGTTLLQLMADQGT